jgi:hypothetical protein
MTPTELLANMHRRMASVSVGPSTVRRMGGPGTVKSIRKYLARLDLSLFVKGNRARFVQVLDQQTEDLRLKALLKGSQHWGVARKCINIFLRGSTYNYLLRQEYRLDTIESFLEVPLDSHVADGLRDEKEGIDLPRFASVISVTAPTNAEYQDVAAIVARRLGICRVHLDLKYWRRDAAR